MPWAAPSQKGYIRLALTPGRILEEHPSTIQFLTVCTVSRVSLAKPGLLAEGAADVHKRRDAARGCSPGRMGRPASVRARRNHWVLASSRARRVLDRVSSSKRAGEAATSAGGSVLEKR